MYQLRPRPLYGGAITLGVPQPWRDLSDVRQVPDHQEVWQDCTIEGTVSGLGGDQARSEGTGAVLVVEILDRQSGVADEDAGRFFFEDLADSNGANVGGVSRRLDLETSGHHKCSGGGGGRGVGNLPPPMLAVPRLDRDAMVCCSVGVQRVALGRDVEGQELRWVRTELCILRLEGVGTDLLVVLTAPVVGAGAGAPTAIGDVEVVDEPSALLRGIVGSLEIQDWTLFG